MNLSLKKSLETIFYFLQLGLLGFGGPLALIAQMQRDWVEKKQWIPLDDFLRCLVVIKAMPGPVAHQMVLFLSNRRSGRWTALFSGIAFLIPSFLMMALLAQAHSEFKENPVVTGFMLGCQMAAISVLFVSLNTLTQSYWSKTRFWILCALGFFLFLVTDIPEPIILLLLGGWSVLFDESGDPPKAVMAEAGALFWVCFSAGAFVFGTGFAIVPMLQTQFVEVHHWVSLSDFKDALAFGMLTPGPILMTVTFLGFKMGGWWLALLATAGVFLPSFIHQLTWFPNFIDKLSRLKWLQIFLVGAIAGVAAGILKSGLTMLDQITTFQAVLFMGSLALTIFSKYPTAVVILGTGVIGAIPYLLNAL